MSGQDQRQKPVGGSGRGPRAARAPLLAGQPEPRLEAEDMRPPAPPLSRWPPTQMAWLPRAYSLTVLQSTPKSLLPTLIWGSKDGARRAPTPPKCAPYGRSLPSFWVVAVCLPILFPGWETLGYPRAPRSGDGEGSDHGPHPSCAPHGDRLAPDCPPRQKAGAQTCCRCSRFTAATRS